MKTGDVLFFTVAAIAVTIVAMSDPKCDRGCKNTLSHLLDHELKFLLSGGKSFL